MAFGKNPDLQIQVVEVVDPNGVVPQVVEHLIKREEVVSIFNFLILIR